MKKILIFLLFSIFFFNSCKKNSSNPVDTNTAPSAPTLLSPADSATNVSIPVTLSWKSTLGDSSYTLQVTADDLFSNFVFNQSELKNTSQQITGLSNGTTYHWRVSVKNNNGTSGWSNVRTFKTAVNSVSFGITQGAGNQGGIIFYATPSVAVTITNVNVSVAAAQYNHDIQGDGTTVYPANQAVSINEFTGVASGQKWVFVFTGHLGTATGTAFSATSNYTVP